MLWGNHNFEMKCAGKHRA